MKLSTTTQVETHNVYDCIPNYTEDEKKMMGDIHTYNFDTIIDCSMNNPNPKILFSTSYDHNEDYRSMFALTENQIRSLITLLQDSLDTLDAKREEEASLEASVEIFGDKLCHSVKENKFNDYKVVIEELSENDKKLQTLHGDTFFISLRNNDNKSSAVFDTILMLAINIDKEILLAINTNKARTTNNRIDKVKETIIHVVKTKLIGYLMFKGLGYNGIHMDSKNPEFNELCKSIYDKIPFEFIFDDSDKGKIKTLIKQNEEDSKKIMKDLDNIMKGPKDLGPTLIPLNKPKPIKAMTQEEAKKISENFMKEYKNKK